MDQPSVGKSEQVVLLGKTDTMVGVITDPSAPTVGETPPAVIILNAAIVHRAGPGRIFVKMARRLAELGFVCVRFDHNGIGDSDVRRDNIPYDEAVVMETREVMDDLSRRRGIEKFVLAGLCSGAETAFRTACCDHRVVGTVMINARGYDSSPQWNRHVINKNLAREYWTQSLFRPGSWWRALTGRIQYRRLVSIIIRQIKSTLLPGRAVTSKARELSSQMHRLVARGCRMLLVYSEDDYGLDYLRVILGADSETTWASGAVTQEVIPRTDHVFTLLCHQDRLFQVVEDWARTTWPTRCGQGHEGL